ncbi:hypothetical protein [Zoogloea sp.]|uniref:hypothetical protein n=1 Tax=Zoogloea sp. TaxID=49181 RepID=UPI001416DCD7|nr:MAG: hypothetical protein F9K15_02350 [Zoogloea sp.]
MKPTISIEVLNALEQQFPKKTSTAVRPRKSTSQTPAQKAIPKIEQALQKQLLKYFCLRDAQDFKLDTYRMSLEQFKLDCGQIGPNKEWTAYWLRDNCALFAVVEAGSNLTGQLSRVKFNARVSIEQTTVRPKTIKEDDMNNLSDTQIAALASGCDARAEEPTDNDIEIVKVFYSDLIAAAESGDTSIAAQYDFLEVDVSSVLAFIEWANSSACKWSQKKKDINTHHANIILAVVRVFGKYPMKRLKSDFGRNYYEGISIQNISKTLRAAVLGNAHEYDMTSSVVAWKLGFARGYLDANGYKQTAVHEAFPTLTLYVENKADLLRTVSMYVYPEGCYTRPEFRMTNLKTAFTALTFGAKLTRGAWTNSAGEYEYPAIRSVITDTKEYTAFSNDSAVKQFMKEMDALDSFILSLEQQADPGLIHKSELMTHGGNFSKAKALAYLYQTAETEVMDVVRKRAADLGHEVRANIHDAVIFKHRLGVEGVSEINACVREITHNPYWKLSHKELSRFNTRHIDVEEQAHKARMQEQEEHAFLYTHVKHEIHGTDIDDTRRGLSLEEFQKRSKGKKPARDTDYYNGAYAGTPEERYLDMSPEERMEFDYEYGDNSED